VRSDARRALGRSLAPLAWMAFIFVLSSISGDTEAAWWEPIARSIGHVLLYLGLTLLWSWALIGVVRRPVVWAAAISLLYAGTDEYHQTFVENRDGTLSDVGLDAIGIALAALWIGRMRASGRPAQA
jgi:VanZ family protein